MRLANEEQSAISDAIYQADADALIYLFGSRVDDTAKGGISTCWCFQKRST